MGITTVIKRLLGVEDVNWDSDGLDSRFPVETSTGDTRSVKRVNSSDIPSTHTLRKKSRIGTGNPITGGKDVDGHLQEVYDDLNKIGEPDDDTIRNSGGVLKVPDGAIGPTQIATDAVITTKILNANVTTEKIALLAVETGQLADDAVTSGKIEDGAVIPAALASNAVETAKIKDAEVTGAKLNLSTGVLKQPNFFCVLAGTILTLASGAGSESSYDVEGLLSTDHVVGQFKINTEVNPASYLQYLKPDPAEDGKLLYRSSSQAVDIHVQYVVFREVTT